MNYYWQTEFETAWSKLCGKLYEADGYNYDKESGIRQYDSEGNEIDVFIEMLSLKIEIEKVKKLGGLFYEFRNYTIQINNLLGVG